MKNGKDVALILNIEGLGESMISQNETIISKGSPYEGKISDLSADR